MSSPGKRTSAARPSNGSPDRAITIVAGRDFLLIADAVAPLGEGVAPLGAAGLSRALAALGHRTTVLTLASADAAARVPGLARRLRTVSAAVGGRTHELTLFEGRALLSDAQLLVLAATPDSRAETAALLAAAVRSLANDKLITPEVTIGWGEPAAAALSATSAAVRLFVLPTGRLGPSLAPPEAELLGPLLLGDESASHSLVALGCLGANAIVAPSPSAARATEGDPGLASRASDEPVDRRPLRLRRPAERSRERPRAAAPTSAPRRWQERPSAAARSPAAARSRSARARCC